MFCINCGAELQENASFCSKCGHKVGQGKPEMTREAHPTLGVDIIKNIVFVIMIICISIGSFLPIMKEKSYGETRYYNSYQYAVKTCEEIEIVGEYGEVWYRTIAGFIYEDMGGVMDWVWIIGEISLIVIFISTLIIIRQLYSHKKNIRKVMYILLIAAEIFAICALVVVWGGIANGDEYFTHRDYIWGETLSTSRSFTIWMYVLLIFPILSWLIWKTHPYNNKKYGHIDYVYEENKCPKCGKEILVGNKCPFCEGK